MNYKAIIAQVEAKNAAETAVKNSVKEQKINILKGFCEPVFEYLLHIQNSPDFRFSAEAHFDKQRNTTRPLLTVWNEIDKEPYDIKAARENLNKGLLPYLLTVELSFASGSAKIYFEITDDFIPSVCYEFGKKKNAVHNFGRFVTSFTELLIKYRK